MTNSEFFQVNSPQVVSETIDGEVVIVDLNKGNYYSLLNTGVKVWESIEKGLSRLEIINTFVNLYDAKPQTITQAVDGFIDILQKEELIRINPNPNSQNREGDTVAETNSNSEKLTFGIPTLEKYNDMEDLLLIDPIHEVEEVGWPNAK